MGNFKKFSDLIEELEERGFEVKEINYSEQEKNCIISLWFNKEDKDEWITEKNKKELKKII